MKIDIKNLPKSERELNIEISSEEMNDYMDKAAKEIAYNGNFDGFRKGKAPIDVIYQRIGKEKIFAEAIQIAMDKAYGEAVKKYKLVPIVQPKAEIKKAAIGNEFVFTLTVAVLPDVELGDYTKVKGKASAKKANEADVEKELNTLLKKRAKYITKDVPAEKGDRVEIDFEARLDGVKIDQGESKNHPVLIGNGMFVPGFEDNLIGMKKDENKEFSIIFPKDYYKKDLAEKNVNFKVTMKIVQKVELPQLNDEFAKSLGKFENVDALKNSIKAGMDAEEEMKAKQENRKKLLSEVVKESKTEIPDVLIESEKDNMIHELEHNISHMGIDIDMYLKNLNTTIDKLKAEWTEPARDRVKANLVIGEIAKKEEIKATDEEIVAKLNETLKYYPNEEEIRKKIDMEKFKNYIAGNIINEKVFETLEKIGEKNLK